MYAAKLLPPLERVSLAADVIFITATTRTIRKQRTALRCCRWYRAAWRKPVIRSFLRRRVGLLTATPVSRSYRVWNRNTSRQRVPWRSTDSLTVSDRADGCISFPIQKLTTHCRTYADHVSSDRFNSRRRYYYRDGNNNDNHVAATASHKRFVTRRTPFDRFNPILNTIISPCSCTREPGTVNRVLVENNSYPTKTFDVCLVFKGLYIYIYQIYVLKAK